jgi:hypothetical protein
MLDSFDAFVEFLKSCSANNKYWRKNKITHWQRDLEVVALDRALV